MERLTCKYPKWDRLLTLTLMLCFAVGAACPVFSQTVDQVQSRAPEAQETPSKIHITAQRLVSSQKERLAEFSGNVRVEQEGTTVSSDRLKVYYKAGADLGAGSDQGGGDEEMIEKIIATGSVSIEFEDRKAFGEEAIYSADSGTLVLTGKSARIVSNGNSITGEKIIMNRNTGEFTVDAGEKKRVEAVFESQAKDANGGTDRSSPDEP